MGEEIDVWKIYKNSTHATPQAKWLHALTSCISGHAFSSRDVHKKKNWPFFLTVNSSVLDLIQLNHTQLLNSCKTIHVKLSLDEIRYHSQHHPCHIFKLAANPLNLFRETDTPVEAWRFPPVSWRVLEDSVALPFCHKRNRPQWPCVGRQYVFIYKN